MGQAVYMTVYSPVCVWAKYMTYMHTMQASYFARFIISTFLLALDSP